MLGKLNTITIIVRLDYITEVYSYDQSAENDETKETVVPNEFYY